MADETLLESLHARGFDDSYVLDRDELGRFSRRSVRVRCSQCEALVICGVATHETGCPNVPKTYGCPECGQRHEDEDAAIACCAPFPEEDDEDKNYFDDGPQDTRDL